MAQTGYTPILIYSSSTTTNAPAAGSLTNSTLGSELAINITDGKLFYKDNANAVQVIAWKTTPTTAGGTGLTSYTAGDMLYYASGTVLSKLAIGTTGQWLGSSGTAPQWNSPAALTKTDDTNVTLTLGGSASTALLNAASLTLGWTGTLAVSRGGTGTGTAFTAGSVIFAGSSGVYTQDNSQFFWDDTNNKLGIGTNNPNPFPGKLIVSGDGTVCDREFNSRVSSGTADGERGYFQVVDGTTEFQIYSPNGGGCVTNIRGVEAMRVHTSRGVSIGNTTDPGAGLLSVNNGLYIGTASSAGAANNTTQTTGGIFTTVNGGGNSLTSGVAATIITLTNTSASQTWLVSANLNGEATNSFACLYAVTLTDNSVVQAVQIVKGNLSSISISGLNIQYTQSSGGTKTNVRWSAIRIM